ncbi:MAG: serine/threonine-protein kinase [Nannocystaceae bacterium]
MNGSAGALGPCPYCGQEHPEEMLVCPTKHEQLPLPGRLLAHKFRFQKLLGEGGMGWVWAAENELVKKSVAIKLMRPEFASNPTILGRFRNEATAAGQIGSPHICDILDFGQSDLGPFIVMELMRGRPLDDLLAEQRRIDPALAVLIVRQALEGLDAAHRAGIIHRDLKPENIFLSEPAPGRLLVKLMDFGISKFSQADSAAGKTGVGVLMGTPEYMSPEQSQGAANVDERTDIWAMGLILYKALTGIDAFGGPTVAATLVAVATREPPPLAQLAPHVPPALAEIIGRCTVKDPAHRFRSARELSDALMPFEGMSFPPPPLPEPGSYGPSEPSFAGGSLSTPMGGGTAAPIQHAHAPSGPVAAATGDAATMHEQGASWTAEVGGPVGAGPMGGPSSRSIAPEDSWSMGLAEIHDARPGREGEAKSGGGGKWIALVVLLLVVVGGGIGLYFVVGPGSGDAGESADAGDAGESAAVVADASASAAAATTGGATTGAATTVDATTGDATAATGDESTSTGDEDEDEDEEDSGSTSKKTTPKANPDKDLVVASGGYYAPKEEPANSDLDGAKRYCANLKKNRYARLKAWKLASSKEVLKFAGKKEISKFLYWTRDASDEEGTGVAVLMVTKKTTNRPVDDKRARPFCIAKY